MLWGVVRQYFGLDSLEYEKYIELEEQREFDRARLLPKDKEKDCEYFLPRSYRGRLFNNWNDFFDDWRENHGESEPRPEYVWATEKVEMHIDAKEIVEFATEDLYEDAMDDISDEDMKKLQEMLDEWTKNCGVRASYIKNCYKVEIPWELYDNL